MRTQEALGRGNGPCHNEIMHHGTASHLLTALSALVSDRPWLCSMVYRQAHQPGRDIPCARRPGDPLKPVREHERCFRREWTAALRAIAEACPAAAGECNVLLQLDPLRPGSDAAIGAAVASIRHLSDPRTVRTAARQRERSAFGGALRRLRVERGLSLRGLAGACKAAAKRLRFHSHTPLPYQIVAFEHGRAGAHRRTRHVIAAALGVPLYELEPSTAF